MGLFTLAVPLVYACAVGESGELPDGSVPEEAGEGGASETGPRHDGGGKKDGGGSGDDGGGGCSDASQCCTSAQCKPTAHVATTACNNGSCAISTCDPGWFEFDASYAQGCNCEGSMNATTCATATVVPPLALGAETTVTGNLPLPADEAYFQITFSGDNTNLSYHPDIELTMNPDNQFVFDVTASCGGPPLSCADVDAATSISTWEEYYTTPGGTGGSPSEFQPIAAVGAAGVVYLHVHRAKPSSTCDKFVVTIKD